MIESVVNAERAKLAARIGANAAECDAIVADARQTIEGCERNLTDCAHVIAGARSRGDAAELERVGAMALDLHAIKARSEKTIAMLEGLAVQRARLLERLRIADELELEDLVAAAARLAPGVN